VGVEVSGVMEAVSSLSPSASKEVFAAHPAPTSGKSATKLMKASFFLESITKR
jgi:hypothetical protein